MQAATDSATLTAFVTPAGAESFLIFVEFTHATLALAALILTTLALAALILTTLTLAALTLVVLTSLSWIALIRIVLISHNVLQTMRKGAAPWFDNARGQCSGA